MSIWIAKAIIQKSISFLPYSHRINYLFQKHITKGVTLTDALMDDKLIHCASHYKSFKQHHELGKNKTIPAPNTLLEIGTGWFPIVPIGMYLLGAGKIYTVDLTPLLRTENVRITLAKFLAYEKSGQLANFLPNILPERLALLKKIAQQAPQLEYAAILDALHIEPLVADARKLDLPTASMDVIMSNNTFEHIYEGILRAILTSFYRLLKPNGIMSHFVDMSDHFAHLDKSITTYNFLQYSPKKWAFIDNDIQPQNRLRLNHQRQLQVDAGFKILTEINRPGDEAAFQKIELDAHFADIDLKDLLVTHTLLVSGK